MGRLKGVIFDLDGVVVNTVPLHFKAWEMMFSEYGVEFSWEVYESKVDGIPAIDAVKAVIEGCSEEEARRAAEIKSRYFVKLMDEEGVSPYPDTLRFLALLGKHQVKKAVISSSRNCPFILNKAGLLGKFEAVVSGEEVEKGKPQPDIFIEACKRLDVGCGAVLVCEDAVLGVEACQRAGIKCIGIARNGDNERLAGADLVVSSFDSVDISVLENLIQKGVK